MALIELQHLCKSYKDITPIKDVSATIETGDAVAIVGPSGTGKTTLIRMINMLEHLTSGSILLNGQDVTKGNYPLDKLRQEVGMVFQSFNLFDHRTVVENIMMGPRDLLGLDIQTAYDRAMALLEKVGLADKELSYPDQLSGGQKQRVAIARTLAMQPKVILFDEPTSALDPSNVAEVQEVMKQLMSEGMTMIIVTHDMQLARSVSNRVFYMDEGIVYEEGPTEQIFNCPSKAKTQQFLRKQQTLQLSVQRGNWNHTQFSADLANYCAKHRVPQSVQAKVSLAIYEAVTVLSCSAEISDTQTQNIQIGQLASDQVEVLVQLEGAKYNPLQKGDEISALLVSRLSSCTEWRKESSTLRFVIEEDDTFSYLKVNE